MASYTLSANLENLVLETPGTVGIGNTLGNGMYSSAGVDTLAGGAGDDIYVVNNTGDIVQENANEGTDTVVGLTDYTLSNNVENLMLATPGTVGVGNGLANGMYSSVGVDTLAGGAGDDFYVINNSGDIVQENAGEGTDTVVSFVSYTLSSNLENLMLATPGTIGTGNSGANIMYSSGGVDTLAGGAGDDIYLVNNTGDVVQENSGEGNDTVVAFTDYTLSGDVENLILITPGTVGTGNSLANVMYSSSGVDTLVGGLGDDLYLVNNSGDVVTETAAPGSGTDTVYSLVDYTLSANVENLIMAGSAVAGTGNSGNNLITGNATTNVLDGAGGQDTLQGYGGNDAFVFHAGQANGDTVVDFDGNAVGEHDTLNFVGYGQGATFANVDATHWQVTYNGGASHEVITFSNGAAIQQSDVLFS